MALKDLKEQAKEFFRTDIEKLEAIEEKNEAYRVIGEELAAGERDLGAWTKALADSGGNEKAAEILYIERMVELKELQGRRAAQEWAEVMQEQLEEEARRKQQSEVERMENLSRHTSSGATEQDYSGTEGDGFLYMALTVAAFITLVLAIGHCWPPA